LISSIVHVNRQRIAKFRFGAFVSIHFKDVCTVYCCTECVQDFNGTVRICVERVDICYTMRQRLCFKNTVLLYVGEKTIIAFICVGRHRRFVDGKKA